MFSPFLRRSPFEIRSLIGMRSSFWSQIALKLGDLRYYMRSYEVI